MVESRGVVAPAQSAAAQGNGELLMSRTILWIARVLAALVLSAPLFPALAVDQATTPAPPSHHKSHKKPTPPLVLPPLPGGPLKPLPMDQIPAASPKVTYQNGLLTIAAENATLGEILSDVRSLTGASIDIPQGGASERVIAQLGPGAPRDVLALLLNGTSFNYVMLGSTSDPTAVATVLLIPKPASGETQTAANTPAAGYQPPQQPMLPGGVMPNPGGFRQQVLSQMPGGAAPVPPTAANANNDNSDDADADDKDDDSDQPQPAQPAQPGQPAGVQPDPNAQQATDPNQPNAGPKTPEQLLEMMRRGQPPGVPNAAPGAAPPPQQ